MRITWRRAERPEALRLGFDAYTLSVREYLEKNPGGDYFGVSREGAEGVYRNVRKHIEVFQNQQPLTGAAD